MSSRVRRRHYRARMIVRATFVVRKWWSGFPHEPEDLALAARRFADNLKTCSCCSPRYDRLDPRQSLQEIRSAIGWREQIEDG